MPTRYTTTGDTSAVLTGAAVLLGSVLLVGCDFEVVNPGPVADEFLDDPAAFQAVVNAVPRELTTAMNATAHDGGIRAREIHAIASSPFENVSLDAHLGVATETPGGSVNVWSLGQRARWIGEDAIRRFGDVMSEEEFGSEAVVAQAHLWTGYANRLLGEYYCEAIFDGGAVLPGDEFHRRAEQFFSGALEIATAAGAADVATAARAGRASVRVHLGDWEGAVADANAVPTDFAFLLRYDDQGGLRYRNSLHYYRSFYTVWNTPYEAHFSETGDPRTPWQPDADEPIAPTSLSPWTEIPRLVQQKYDSDTSPVQLSSGEEMRLIEAEALLRDGDVVQAMQLINALRQRAGVDAQPAAPSQEEAWTYLKRERGIELWLEGRRLSDLRRWKEGGTPGALALQELGTTNGGPDLSNRALCMPIPEAERETNPNL